ncbi:MAG: TetR/AcrR family transcriptional regulator [Lachnospiraceae bacterium]|nr:TetR/AcrR family transcriptional regulator [Lachnospiraceae bacterium]
MRMGRNPERDARAMAARKQKILQHSFKVFSTRGIDGVSMNDVAKACKIGCATLYRHYTTKPALAAAVAVWAWENRILAQIRKARLEGETAAAQLASYLDLFLELYRKQPEALRFDLYFRVYARNEHLPEDQAMASAGAVSELANIFSGVYAAAGQDGTVKTEMGEKKMFSFILDTLLYACSRSSAAFSYTEGSDSEGELVLLKDTILRTLQTA